jgi:hypothetical protein
VVLNQKVSLRPASAWKPNGSSEQIPIHGGGRGSDAAHRPEPCTSPSLSPWRYSVKVDRMPFVKPEEMNRGANALSAPITPERRIPVVDKSKIDPQLRKAAEGMEAMFLDFLMQVMRNTVPENEMGTDSPAVKLYTGMLDSEVSQKAAHSGGVGLADQIIAYMEAQRYTLPKGNRAPPAPQTQDTSRDKDISRRNE